MASPKSINVPNQRIVHYRFRAFKQEFEKEVETRLYETAREMVDMIDRAFVAPRGSAQYPVYTFNLHDATGVGVYINGKCTAFIPTKRASVPQSDSALGDFWGTDALQSKINMGATRFSDGYWIVLFSAVPYAIDINRQGSPISRGMGFFELLAKDLADEILLQLKPIGTLTKI